MTPVTGRDDPHPPDGEPLVERRDPDPADEAGEQPPHDVLGRWRRLAGDDRQPAGQDHPHQLRNEHYAKQRGTAGQEAAPEVGEPPGRGGEQAQQDRRRLRRTEIDQAVASDSIRTDASAPPLPSRVPAPASTAVGPSRTTTASAAAS